MIKVSPIQGTTGKTAACRSFLWPFLKNSESVFSDYYLEHIFPGEELAEFAKEDVKRLLKEAAMSFNSLKETIVTADTNETQKNWLVKQLFPLLDYQLADGIRIMGKGGVFEPGYVLKKNEHSGSGKTEYLGKEAGGDILFLMWTLPWRRTLDAVIDQTDLSPLPVMEIAHRAMLESGVPWAIITNGRHFSLLSKESAHRPRAYLLVDLEAIIDRYSEDEAQIAFQYFLGLFSSASFCEKDERGANRLDRAYLGSKWHGKEIGDELKQNVYKALEEIGDGSLFYFRLNTQEEKEDGSIFNPNNQKVIETFCGKHRYSTVEEWLSSEEVLNAIYYESLSLMYRLLFLFYAESRNLLPMADEMYRERYSLESLRNEIMAVHDDPDPKHIFSKGNVVLWDRLKELFYFVNSGWKNVISVYNGDLFDPEQHAFLEKFKVPDYFLARAIDLLSRTKPRPGRSRAVAKKKITYRDLDVRHLGSIYEGILEYSAHAADWEMAVMKRGTGLNTYEEFVPLRELKGKEKEQYKAWSRAYAENPDDPEIPHGCRVTGFKPKGSYFLVYGGRESKRKSSGSYYTPDHIVQYIVENTLGPVIRGECRPEPKTSPGVSKESETGNAYEPNVPLSPEEILELKVLDPAMGSGHFLVAATEYLARAYGEALIREGRDEDGIMSDDEFIRYKRLVVERCIFGVDINPTAVELAKLSLWLVTLDPSRPLSFLDHHLKCGNSLIGAWIADLGNLPVPGKKRTVPIKDNRKRDNEKQHNLFEEKFKAQLPPMIRDLLKIIQRETIPHEDIQTKKILDAAVAEMKKTFGNIADAWTGAFFHEDAGDYLAILSDLNQAKQRTSRAAKEYKFFHWEMEFPEVWFDSQGLSLTNPGFHAVIGNPPWGAVFSKEEQSYLAGQYAPVPTKTKDSFLYFAINSLDLLRDNGALGLIMPNTWLLINNAAGFRKEILSRKVIEIKDFGDGVFEGVTVESAILILCNRKEPEGECRAVRLQGNKEIIDHVVDKRLWLEDADCKILIEMDGNIRRLLDKLHAGSELFKEQCTITWGIKPYQTGYGDPPQTKDMIAKRIYHSETKKGEEWKPLLVGSNVDRYKRDYPGNQFIKYGKWLMYPSNEKLMTERKILMRQTSDAIRACYDDGGFYCQNSVFIIHSGNIHLKFLLGLLNSRVLNFVYRMGNPQTGKTFAEIKPSVINRLPVYKMDWADDEDRACHQQIIALVEEIQNVARESVKHTTTESRILRKKKFSEIYEKIERQLQKLYGLTDGEIKIIEQHTSIG